MMFYRFSTIFVFAHSAADGIGNVAPITGEYLHSISNIWPASDDDRSMATCHGVDKVCMVQQPFGQRLTFVVAKIRASIGDK